MVSGCPLGEGVDGSELFLHDAAGKVVDETLRFGWVEYADVLGEVVKIAKSTGAMALRCRIEKEISIWFSHEAGTGRWTSLAFGCASSIRRTERQPLWEEPLSTTQQTRFADPQGWMLITSATRSVKGSIPVPLPHRSARARTRATVCVRLEDPIRADDGHPLRDRRCGDTALQVLLERPKLGDRCRPVGVAFRDAQDDEVVRAGHPQGCDRKEVTDDRRRHG